MPLLCLLGLIECATIPPVNKATMSGSAAPANAFAQAQRAVQVCSRLPNASAMFDGFEAMGFRSTSAPDRVSRQQIANGGERVVIPNVRFDNGQVIVQAGLDYCHVGLRNMTPSQSLRLGEMLAGRYGARTNAELGQGLSDHVVQAWQVRNSSVPKVLIASLKTWPWDRGQWPKTPGAAVTLTVN